MIINKYILINVDANAIGKVKEINLNQNGTVDSLIVKYKGDRAKYLLRPNKDNFQLIKLKGIWNIIKWSLI